MKQTINVAMYAPDLFFSSSLLILGILLIISVYLILLSFNYNKKPATRLPPGKLGWPIIGETLNLAFSCRRGSFYKFISDRMNKYSPQVFKTSLLGEKVAVFCGPSGNKFLFSNENKLVSSWWPSSFDKISDSSASSSTSGIAKDLRSRIFPEILKINALHGHVSKMHTLVQHHLETKWCWSSSNQLTIKAHPLIKELLFGLSCSLFIGIQDDEWVANLSSHFVKVIDGLFSMPIDFPGTPLRRGIKAANALRDMLYPIIDLRRSQLLDGKSLGTKDLLSPVLTAIGEATVQFPVNVANKAIADGIIGLLIASHDTTSSVLTSLVSCLADHPDVYEQVFHEQMEIAKTKGPNELLQWEDVKKMKYSRNVINEVMRISPAAQGSFRKAITDFTFAGYTIPKGWKIFWSNQTTHKNPDYFPNPEKFDPSRFEGDGPIPFTYTPFGGGPRMCPGSEFARLEILIVMHCLVTKFRWEKLIPDEKIYCTASPYPAEGLPIRLIPHEN